MLSMLRRQIRSTVGEAWGEAGEGWLSNILVFHLKVQTNIHTYIYLISRLSRRVNFTADVDLLNLINVNKDK